MARKIDKKVRELALAKIRENGFISTDAILDFVGPFYDFDPNAARKREIRRYVGQLVRTRRDKQGARTTFLEKSNSQIVDIDACHDAARVELVGAQLLIQSKGLWKSLKKAELRRCELEDQLSSFDEEALLHELRGSR